jgi:hypothetical protein
MGYVVFCSVFGLRASLMSVLEKDDKIKDHMGEAQNHSVTSGLMRIAISFLLCIRFYSLTDILFWKQR